MGFKERTVGVSRQHVPVAATRVWVFRFFMQ